jgi:uncharacterized protein YcfJ
MKDTTNTLFEEIPYDINVEEQLEKENLNDTKYLAENTEKIKEIMKDINELIENDEDKIVFAEFVSDDIQKKLENTKKAIDKARYSQKQSNILKGTLISAGIGACIVGPIGAVIGSSINLTVAGTVIGSISTSAITGTIASYILGFK